jgi:hypothetical protein
MALFYQLLLQVEVVVDLAVTDQDDRTVFVVDRLIAAD